MSQAIGTWEVEVEYLDGAGVECAALFVVEAWDRRRAVALAMSLAEDEGWQVEGVYSALRAVA